MFSIVLALQMFAATANQGAASLPSLGALNDHLGEYPCQTGVLAAPVLRASLKSVLGADYPAYEEHMSLSGCGAIEQRGEWILLDVSQLHVGGYDSLILVRPSDGAIYVSWLRSQVLQKQYKLYGPRPIPDAVKQAIVDNLNQGWGHVASFRWNGEELQIVPTH